MSVADPIELYENVLRFCVVPLVGFSIHYLQQISQRLADISVSLAVVASKIDSHEQRLHALEQTRLNAIEHMMRPTPL